MEPFLGQIVVFGFDFAPQGWAHCDGQMMAINTNTALFALLGTKYGGDGITSFALPNLNKDLTPGEPRFCIALAGIFPSRQ